MENYDLVDPNQYEPPGEGLVLKRALKRKSVGDSLSNNVVAPLPRVLPNAIDSLRSRAGNLYKQGADLYNSEPDMAQLQNFAKQRGQQGDAAMLNAMAAQFAGEGFAPLQEQLLKKASASSEPMKFGAGMLSPDGSYIKDPFAAQEKKAEFLLSQAKMYEQMATTAETKQDEQAYRALQDEAMNEIRNINAESMRMNAISQRQNADSQSMNANSQRMNAETNSKKAKSTDGGGGVGGGVGVGTATQVGSSPSNEPIFRQKNGQLFFYDQNGQPTAYQGPVMPRASSAQPSEDERKAAGWFFQADNARKNMENVVKRNPGAAYPTVAERVMGAVPLFGEDISNSLRPEDRQMFVQAGSSMAEALLRAATGAGVNESEAKQKVRELVPQLADTPGLVAQKTASYDVYMKSLQARAGRALPQNSPGAAQGFDGNDPLGLRRKP